MTTPIFYENINIENIENIESKNYIKYLEVYIDKHLNWQPQIQHINNKIARNAGILTILRHYVEFNMLKNIYYASIYPYLSYGITTWGCATNTNLKCLCIKQNRCLRSIFFANVRESANPY